MSVVTIQDVPKVIAKYVSDVDKLPLRGPDGEPTPHYGLFRQDTGACLPIAVKRGFEAHTLADVIALTEAAVVGMESQHECQITATWGKCGQRVIVAPSREQRRAIFGTRDNIFPRLVIGADFGRMFTLDCGMFRDACTNLSVPMLVEGTGSNVAIRHTRGLRDRMDTLISACRRSAGDFNRLADAMAQMERTEVAIVDFLADMYPAPEVDSKKAATQHKKRTELIMRRLYREALDTGRRFEERRASLYQVVNAITGYIQHDKTRHGSPTMVQRAVAALDDAEASRGWQLANAMLSA